MSEQTSQEPTMEEILASIRRIISEDEPSGEAAVEEPEAAAPVVVAPEPQPAPPPEPEPVKADAPPAPPPEPAPAPVAAVASAPSPEPIVEDDDDDDALELTQKVETLGDLDVVETEAPAAPPLALEPNLVSAPVAMAAASAFGQLSAAIGMPRSDRTLEDVVREMLQPMLQQWLNENLPKIVQEAVEAEVDRISRARVR